MRHVTRVLLMFDSRCVLCVIFCDLLCVYDFHICTTIYMMSQVTHMWWVISRMYYLCLTRDVCCALFFVFFFCCIQLPYLHNNVYNESCHTYIMSHVAHILYVMSRMYYLRLIRDACCALFFVIFLCVYDFHICTRMHMMSHITRVWWVMSYTYNESCHTYMTSHATHVLPVFDSRHVLCVFFVYLFCVYDFHICTRIYMVSHITRV